MSPFHVPDYEGDPPPWHRTYIIILSAFFSALIFFVLFGDYMP